MDENKPVLETLDARGFSLVLSGGAALGCAHLGVLDRMEECRLVPREIIGTSMGAIVGAALACEYPAREIAEFFERFAKLRKWVRFSWSDPGLFKTERIAAIFTELFGERTLAETTIPLKVTATDFESGRARVFGAEDPVPIRDALLCSMSIPVLFPPVALEGRYYVDGFLSANLPIEFAQPGTGALLAVDVFSERSLNAMRSGSSVLGKARGLIENYERAFHLLVTNQTREILRRCEDVHLLQPALAGYKVHDFHQWRVIREAGYREACSLIRSQDHFRTF